MPVLNLNGFALIELFTSEGCSSCPPADELLAKINRELRDQPVYILAFHVDYWNRLGWKDVYSSADYSKRQNQYARWLNLRSVYTPQVVINGQKEFVGSEETTLRNAIKSSLRKPSFAKLVLSEIKRDQRQISLHYQTEGTDQQTSLFLAVVQLNAQSKVKSGENSGHTLSHVQIVRQFKQIPLKGGSTGIASIELPKDLDPEKSELVAFLQNDTDGKIIAATRYK
ncbi:DUF1223 domain-containing protein [Pedobacter sp. PAMC26386]|nr:DUF1223 domain-containing protein [Pedobacter sp. PAMC26386]